MLDGSISYQTPSLITSKKDNDKQLDDEIDLESSEGQIKCSKQLTTIFNLLDHQKMMSDPYNQEEEIK